MPKKTWIERPPPKMMHGFRLDRELVEDVAKIARDVNDETVTDVVTWGLREYVRLYGGKK